MNTTSNLESAPRAATAADFADTVLAASARQAVLVDFWAAWCGPCKALGPILEEVARERAGQVSVVKIDADVETDLAAQYGVRALPTLLVFKGGKVVDQFVGLRSAADIVARLDAVNRAG